MTCCRQEIATPGESMSGPVVFRDPVAGATPARVQQIRQYTDIGSLSIDEGYMSPKGQASKYGWVMGWIRSTGRSCCMPTDGTPSSSTSMCLVSTISWQGQVRHVPPR